MCACAVIHKIDSCLHKQCDACSMCVSLYMWLLVYMSDTTLTPPTKPLLIMTGRCRLGFVQCKFSGEMKKMCTVCKHYCFFNKRTERTGDRRTLALNNILHNPLPGSYLLWDGCQLRNVFRYYRLTQ